MPLCSGRNAHLWRRPGRLCRANGGRLDTMHRGSGHHGHAGGFRTVHHRTNQLRRLGLPRQPARRRSLARSRRSRRCRSHGGPDWQSTRCYSHCDSFDRSQAQSMQGRWSRSPRQLHRQRLGRPSQKDYERQRRGRHLRPCRHGQCFLEGDKVERKDRRSRCVHLISTRSERV